MEFVYNGPSDIRKPLADTAVRPYTEFVIGAWDWLNAAQLGRRWIRLSGIDGLIKYPAAREGVAALPYTEFVEFTFIGENVQSGKEGTGFVI